MIDWTKPVETIDKKPVTVVFIEEIPTIDKPVVFIPYNTNYVYMLIEITNSCFSKVEDSFRNI